MLGLQIVSTITSFFTPVDKYIISPLKDHISYAFAYTSKVAELRHNVQRLTDARDNLQNSVDDARRRGEEIQNNVEKWLADAEKAIQEAEKLIQGEEEAKKNRCFAGMCPDLKAQYQLGKKAANESLDIATLENEGKFDTSRISYLPAPQQIVPSSVHGFEGLPSRASIFKKVMDALTDPNVNIVGVYGMGGTGKTTLAKEVHKHAIEGKLFDVVARVTLSENPEPEKIQENIAEVLGLTLKENTLDVRAYRLHQSLMRLTKEKKVLIILDNLWGKIDLENLGILLTNEQRVNSRGYASIIEQEKDNHKGCTILLTSRIWDLLTNDMGVQEVFMLDVLPEKESWTLFESLAGDLKIPRLQSIAIEVAKKCAGLPLLLVTVASALKNKDLEVWEDTLKRLSTFEDEELQKKVYSVIELSYDRLASEEAKSFFLLCGLFTYGDILIQDLLNYSMGLGLLKQINTVQSARNRVHKLIGELKSSCLLLDSEWDACVKIHDVVQDVAASIASRTQLAFKKVGGPLEECQRVDFKCFTRIIMEDTNISEFPLGLQCPETELVHLAVRDRSSKIPDSFFEGMTKLRVLHFTGMCFSALPSSLLSVTSIHTLCLDFCTLHDVSVICQLKNLEVLSLKDSEIVELPRDFAELTRLKLLDLSGCAKLEFIPENVLSRLSLLEELHMGNSFARWEVKRFDDQSNASLYELKHLSRLTNLEIEIPDARKLSEGLFSERLERFKIFIGDGWDWRGRYQTSRTLKLKLDTSIHSWGHGIKILLKTAEDLYLDEVKGVTNVLHDLYKEGFPQLKHIHVQNGSDIRYMIDSEGRLPFDAFPILESLILHNLVNLEKICVGQLMAGDFCQLRILRVRRCNRLKNLFSISMVKNFKQLHEMEVMDCSDIEEIFASEIGEEEDDKNEVFEFTQLCVLKLQLPLLRRFCSKVKSSPASTSSTHSRQNQSTIDPRCPLFNEMIAFPNLKELNLSSITVESIWWNQSQDHSAFYNLKTLIVEACWNINYLFDSVIVRNLGQLQRLEICKCRSMEVVIAMEGEMISKVPFPNLEFLKFKNLSKLVKFCNSDFMELPSLKELWIENCPALKSFISNPITTITSRANLALFDEKVAFPKLEELRIQDMNGLKIIWHNELHEGSFCKLKTMVVQRAKELENVFPSNMLMSRFLNLERLHLIDCELLEEIFYLLPHEELINFSRSHGMSASQLKILQIENLPNLKNIWKKDARKREIIFFHKLHDMDVFQCPSLKSIFPTSIALCLLELKELAIRSCRIEEIIDRGGNIETIPKFEFPQLTSLTLYNLEQLKALYPGTHTSDWPMLKKLRVHACPKMEIFSLECGTIGGKSWRSQLENPSGGPFFTIEKVIPNLEELALNSKGAKLILDGLWSEHLFDKVTSLHLQSFDEESASFFFDLLRRFRNLESLDVGNNWLQELFSCEGLINQENQGRTIAKIRNLHLDFLYKLKRVGKQDCRLDHMFESLETLEVWRCDSLISLVPSINIASFRNLSRLDVWHCEGLLNLVTSSTAQCLGLLTELSIRQCSMVNEVVARKEDDKEDQITWGNLKSLKLYDLSSLTYFCSAYHTFNFPSLEEVIITRCPKLKAFSQGVSITLKLKKVKLAEVYNDKGHWEGDLNTTIQQLCAELVGLDGIDHLELSEHPQLKAKWHNEEFPAHFFSNLKSLMVDECASLSTAIPSNLLPFLDNLLELEVKNCDLVEEVFNLSLPNVADGPIGTLPKLNKLQLIDLPRLKHVWNEEPTGLFEFRNLKVIKIHNCPTLKCIFTPTMCLGLVRLQELEVKDCRLIEEIIPKEATTCNVVFPLLSSIALEHLPNLTSFYPGSGTVRCPSLQKIAVFDCSSAFTFTFFNEPPPNATNLANQAKIVFPNLKDLQLSSIKVEEIWNSQHIDQSSCFQHLTTLIVEDCDNLRYIFTSFMVEHLNQIKRLDICNCKSVAEVVLRQDVGNGESSSKMLFPKVEVLKLEGLPKLATFCTCNLLECPVLKTLQIDNCPRLNSLVSDPASADVASKSLIDKCDSPLFDDKVAIPEVDELIVRNMYWLKTIWHDELHEDSFCKLRILRVEQAESLLKVFPSNMLVRRFQNLEQLFIKDCESLEEVFDIQGLMISAEESQNATATWTRLKTLDIRNLPNLKHVWNQDPRELFFQNLNDVFVDTCPILKSLFPASVARGLQQLETLDIDRCGIEETVEKEEEEETIAPDFVFPKLTRLKLWRLSELKRFYPGRHISEWPALKELDVYHCDKMHILEFQRFQQEQALDGIQVERSLFSFKEVIPNLEHLALTCKEATIICEGQFPEKFFHNLKSLELQCFHEKSAILPTCLLERFPNIGTLFLGCNQHKELLPYGLTRESKHAKPIPQIQHLRIDLHSPNAMRVRNQGHQIDQLLQNLDVLEVWNCNSLTNLAPFSASFQSVTSLDIFKCQALVHLFTLSTAETLVQLRKLEIRNCAMATEIIASTGHVTKHEIVFHKLESLKLHYLPSLISFCSGEHSFKFPSLTKAIVSQCPKMENFSKGVSRTPKLQSVKLTQQKDREHWNDNLNTAIQHLYKKMVGFHGLQELRLIDFPNLKEAWHNELPVECFYDLRSLVVDNCASFSKAMPSSLLSFLNRLKKLDVRNCDSLEEVFFLEGLDANPEHLILSKLNEFLLSDLPKLRHIWNKAFCGILDFKNLKLLKVQNCSSLKYIFTPTMALSLVQIQELEVKNCTFVEEIITSGDEEAVVDTMFSQLNSLVLESLPNLTSFCSPTNVLELQSLEKLTIVDCPKIETFTSTILGAQEPSIVDKDEERLGQEGISTPAVLLFGAKVTCRSFKELKVEWNNSMKDMLRGKFPAECFAKIKVLELTNFPHEETLFPSDILLKLTDLEKLVVNDAHFGELFLQHRRIDKDKNDEEVTKLRQLKLSKLPNLSQLFQHHSIPDLVIQNLEILEVMECVGLKILMSSLLSFQNLTTLEVSKCHGLTKLMTSSTAKSLEKLTRMSITECDMLEEVVASEGNEGEDEIAFSQLKHLGLHCLPNFMGFCYGNHTFNFPSLEEVVLRECSKMKFFSEGALFTPQLTEVQIALDEDQWRWEGSLNATIQQLFSEMGVGNAQGH